MKTRKLFYRVVTVMMLVAVLLLQGAINYATSVEVYAAVPPTEHALGSGGKVTTPIGSGDDSGQALAIQPDGKVVVAGYTDTTTDVDYAVVRYNPDGSLDTTFGDDGIVLTDFGYNDRAYAVTLQADGKIVVAGSSKTAHCCYGVWAIARYNSDGSLDTSFGSGGKVTTDFNDYNDHAHSVAIQPDGKIVVTGMDDDGWGTDFAVARYNSDGSLDTTFSGDGKVVTRIDIRYDEALADALLQDDGKIVLAGCVQTGTPPGEPVLAKEFGLARYNSDGSLDTSFGNNGLVVTDLGTQYECANASALQSDGKIVLAGYAGGSGSYNVALARYNGDGTFDTTFGDNGEVIFDLGSTGDYIYGIALQTDGKIVVAGYSGGDFALLRYHTDGSLDTTFGGSGYVTTDFAGGEDWGLDVAIQTDGKIVVAGSAYNGTDYDFALARYNTDGSLDTTFGGGPTPCGWHTELVDSAGDVGFGARLALDTDDHPHIAYLDYTNLDLKYAHYDGTTWHIETVHSSNNTGHGPSLAIDANGNPHIAWTYYTPSYSVMYGYHDGSTWHIENISPGTWPKWNNIAIDSANHPHVSYWADLDWGPIANSVMYAWHDGTLWHSERVDYGSSLGDVFVSMTLDSLDRPHIAYSGTVNRVLKYAWYDGTWHIETVYGDGQAYGPASIAVDSSGYPRILFQDRTRDVLEYFWNDGGSWHRETIGNAAYTSVFLELDSLDNAHISYTDYDGANYYVKYAYQNGGVWQTETVALGSGGGSGAGGCLALDAYDKPHIAYRSPAGDLWYASKTAGIPPTANAGGPYAADEGSSVTLDASGSSGNISLYEWDLNNDGQYDDATGVTTEIAFDDNGIFTVGLEVTDECGESDTDTTEVTVLNVAPTVETPTVAPEPSDEGSAVTASATLSDPGVNDAPFTCSVNYGDGSGDLTGTVSGNTCTGPAYTYADNGSYSVTVSVTDKDGDAGSNATTHVVNNIAPTVDAPTVAPEPSDEGSAVTANATFSDPGVNDAPFTCSVNYGDGSGDLPGTVSGKTCTGPAHTYADNGSYSVTVSVTDKDGDAGSNATTHVVNNIAPTVDTPTVAPEPSDEGGAVTASATFSDPGVNDAPFTCSVNYGDGSGDLPGTVSGNTCTGPVYTYADNGSYSVTISVTDKDGDTGSNTATHVVLNVAPTMGEISAPIDPVQVNTEISASADFTDPGVLDTHTAVWDWGDDTTSAGTVDETAGSGSASGSHTYTAAGVYTVKLTVTDDDGDSGESVFQYIVVYDPEGGFVTGGGWIDSPAGAYTPDPSLTGKATFGFVAKYKKGADTPTGQTEFRFRVANLNFHSDTYQWLVVAGPKAQFKGTGTINGAGNYGFMLTAIDAELTPSIEVDRFRIKIWDKDNNDAIVYDNQMDAADDAEPATAIGGGSIVIHKAK